MQTKTRTKPTATKVLARKLKELHRERQRLEGEERRGFLHDTDEMITQRRLREVRKDITAIEAILEGED